MRLEDYLFEKLNIKKKVWTVVNLNDIDKETRHKLWDMYVDTYQTIGLHVESIDKLVSKYKVSWMIDTDKDPEPDAFVIYKETQYGNKIALMGTDGNKLNKRLLIYKVSKLLKTKGWYAEASHKVAKIFLNKGIKTFTDIDLIKKILGKSDIISTDEKDVYKRKIGTLGVIKKRLFGSIK